MRQLKIVKIKGVCIMFSVILPMQWLSHPGAGARLMWLGLIITLYVLIVLIVELTKTIDRLNEITKTLDDIERDSQVEGDVTFTPLDEQANYIAEDSLDVDDLEIESDEGSEDEQE